MQRVCWNQADSSSNFFKNQQKKGKNKLSANKKADDNDNDGRNKQRKIK